jgi:hypothetical protein
MSSVFVSYCREDEVRASALAKALMRQGLDVWWDKHLVANSNWRSEIEAAIERSDVVVVCWSKASVGERGAFVKDEASRAGTRLIQVLLEGVNPPLGFGEYQAIDFKGWKGSTRDPFFSDLMGAISAKLNGEGPPKPKGPTKAAFRRLLYQGGGSALVLSLMGVVLSLPNVQSALCKWEVSRPYTDQMCCFAGVSEKELKPSGKKLLATRSAGSYLRQAPAPFVSQADAARDAQQRAVPDAEILCTALVHESERLVSSSAKSESSDCRETAVGWFCGLNYVAVCQVEVPELVLRCPAT